MIDGKAPEQSCVLLATTGQFEKPLALAIATWQVSPHPTILGRDLQQSTVFVTLDSNSATLLISALLFSTLTSQAYQSPELSPLVNQGEFGITRAILINEADQPICYIETRGKDEFATNFMPTAPEDFQSQMAMDIPECEDDEEYLYISQISQSAHRESDVAFLQGAIKAGITMCVEPILIGAAAGVMGEISPHQVPGEIPGTFACTGLIGGGPGKLLSRAVIRNAPTALSTCPIVGFYCGRFGDRVARGTIHLARDVGRDVRSLGEKCERCVKGVTYIGERISDVRQGVGQGIDSIKNYFSQ